ncbi:MAG: leucine--tRNA ligase [Proteobacteria bacterium]|nr:leucine--tRNA ligase [Pseudomonadota bacterium]
MNSSYKPADVESAAQAKWASADAYRVIEDANKKKYYACSMLPYPSGKLHMGHVRNYTINDMLTRYLRMSGYNVLMPMGWDAFGLPAENAALKNGVPPAAWTMDNIAYMKGQLQAMGLAIDWSREVATCDPSYYKWNQWLFLKMLEKGIAYRKTQVVNWDPVDQTVLANEQVIDGKGWRTGAPVERREIPGYYLKISDYAPELLEHTQHKLPGWPERVRLMQENWIGKSEGVRFAFTHTIKDHDGHLIQDGRMYVFTTRADTIMGVTFCAVAPEHPLAQHAARTNLQVANFIDECKAGGTTEAELATQEKKGVPTGLVVTHPITEELIPVWVGNYVLMSYGDGAVMGVPAHDERDFAFANKYNIDITQVVLVEDEPHFDYHKWQEWYGDKERGITINSDNFSGMGYQEAVKAVAHALEQKGLGGLQTTWRLRDWGISRQRYWGTPIPIIHCDEHGAVPVPEKDLPVVLPTDCVPDGSGNPLNKHAGFHAGVTCPVCGKAARRETDTMDTFVDSSWYFMRYCDPKNDQAMVGEGAQYWMPMDQYIGGIEHAILHLLYARFWTKVMRDLGLVSIDEPFSRLLTQGMVLNQIFFTRNEKGGKDYHPPSEVTPKLDASGHVVGGTLADGTEVQYGGVGKMGKSERNGVDPQELIEKYGADTARLYTMFTAPPEATLEWNDAAVEGSFRFLRRVWNYGVALNEQGAAEGTPASKAAKALRHEVHTVLRQIDYDYQRMQYNTVVSGAMKLLNALESFKPADAGDVAAAREGFGILLRTLYPVTPHAAFELWQSLGYDKVHGDLLDAPWPQVDEAALEQDEIELMLQINGKLRGSLVVPAGASKQEIETLALASEGFAKFAEGAVPKRVIVVPGRLVNVVV